MVNKNRKNSLLGLSVPFSFLMLVSASLLVSGALAPGRAGAPGQSEPEESAAIWTEIGQLIDDQKYQAAADRVETQLEVSIERDDSKEWTRSLIQLVQLQTALHGYETAVRTLQETPWPAESFDQAVLQLFYSQGFVNYLNAYSWEIRQREQIESTDELDLKKLTQDQILAEAQTAYLAGWDRRSEWADRPLGVLGDYVALNNYPPRIRGTLRDGLTYLWVELLSNSSFWRPDQSNEIFRLDRESLVRGAKDSDIDLADPAVHPLVKIGHLLGDLESWHLQASRLEAAFAARVERLRLFHAAFDRQEDRLLVRHNLEEHLSELDREAEWWSVGQAELARMVQQEPAADALVRARGIALEGGHAHPDSVGGAMCRSLVSAIEAPDFTIASMRSDGIGKRSIEVDHKNLQTLYFRAYRIDVRAQIKTSRDYNLLPAYREIPEILEQQDPAFSWQARLAATPDFRLHKTWVTPPLEDHGLFLVVASSDEGFLLQETGENKLAAVFLQISDLVVLSRDAPGGFKVEVRSGESGEALGGAVVELYKYDYKKGHRLVAQHPTLPNGQTQFAVRDRQNQGYFLLAEREGDQALDSSQQRVLRSSPPHDTTSALIYTDRSIYRPKQQIQWKVVAYKGLSTEGRYQTLPGKPVTVDLLDTNGELVASREVRTNDYGSASGVFEIAQGRMLGRWRLRSSLGGQSWVQVEEYKRPTFELTLLNPDEALRLNRPVQLAGQARYYFGLPVAVGELTWTVERQPLYPPWWHWWGGYPGSASQVIATGVGKLEPEGGFQISFNPEADERDRSVKGLTYSYRLSVEVTDEGGETRTVERSFRLGFVSVAARFDAQSSFFFDNEAFEIAIHRTDLDGVGRAGKGRWQLLRLIQPEQALLPADQPLPPIPDEQSVYATPGDRLRSRSQPAYVPSAILRLWGDGERLQNGSLTHDDEGQAQMKIGGLEPGAYRIRYTTKDDYGAEFETSSEFLVTGPDRLPLALPAILRPEKRSVSVGSVARLLVHSALPNQQMVLELFRNGLVIERHTLEANAQSPVVEIPVEKRHRGGFGVRLTALRDHQLMLLTDSVMVPWEDRELEIRFATFRDLLRPGGVETWRIEVDDWDGRRLGQGAAEILAYMYDRSLDLFAPHSPPRAASLYPVTTAQSRLQVSLGKSNQVWQQGGWYRSVNYHLHGDRLRFFDSYPIGGLGRRGRYAMKASAGVFAEDALVSRAVMEEAEAVGDRPDEKRQNLPASAPAAEAGTEIELRTDFSETAFWKPHLLLGEDGSLGFEFSVPDSVTEWNVWVHALTNDLKGGSLERQTRTVKELMVRPYLPRFLRQGDRAQLRVAINNASERELSGRLDFAIVDPNSGEDLSAEFGLAKEEREGMPFTVAAGKGGTLTFAIDTPARLGTVAIEVRARAGDLSDGEIRPMPLLPGRMQLSQSRFVSLRDRDRRTLKFADLESQDDPSLINEQMVVTLDAQLFYGVLKALPYLVDYPYECTEQTLNRFVSTGIVSSLYESYPEVAKMAQDFAARETRLESWNDDDPNRKMMLEETPWLVESRGGGTSAEDLINVLDPRIAKAQMKASIAKLEQAQTSLGGFPWWSGGPPSPYMTLYLLHGLSRAIEFDVDVPKQLVVDAWGYMHRHYVDEIVDRMMANDCCWETVTFLNYVLSSYTDASWTGEVFSAEDRQTMLEYSFQHWKRHSPLLKSYLALTLARSGRLEDANLVFASVMDSAKSSPDEGVFWAPEDRAWLWYNDTIETHAFALRTLLELDPADEKRHGLVQWLFLNKKLNHWKSTRATAEVIYSLVHYLEQEGTLGAREAATVQVAGQTREFVFEPGTYSGNNNQIVLSGEQVTAAAAEGTSGVIVEKDTPGFMFVSATWHFSTEKMPEEGSGDLFAVRRTLFKRVSTDDGWVLRPLRQGARVEIGDQLEVQLSIRAKSAAEYVHLRDPRGAGFEPESFTSGTKWDLGISWYEEIRDSGTNFFFERLPVGEYTLRYRVRAAVSGTFRTAPATLQSMYAPEFSAYSSGAIVEIAN